MVSLRLATVADIETLATLLQETVLAVGHQHYTPAQTQAWANGLDRDRFSQTLQDSTTYVAENGDQIVGFASLRYDGCIAFVYVHHQHQRRGIGSALIEQIFAQAQGDRLHRLFSEASEFSYCRQRVD